MRALRLLSAGYSRRRSAGATRVGSPKRRRTWRSGTWRRRSPSTRRASPTPAMTKYPKPEYSLRIDWTCDPERASALVQRVFQEIDLVRGTLLPPDRIMRLRELLLREFEQNSQENGYLLNVISRRYEDG